MRILVTNDDGIRAGGIKRLAQELEKEHEVIIVAPETQMSAQSHAITLHTPLKIKEVKLEGIKSLAYSVSGTPADCVRAGLEAIIEGDIDLVVSGINLGYNSGMDILYSGTVSAAIEANIYDIPSIAVSSEWKDHTANYEVAAKYTLQVLDEIKDDFLKSNMVLNINTPYDVEENKEIKVCKIGGVIYDYYHMEKNGDGEHSLTLKGRKETKFEEGTDRYYLDKGYPTLTPLYYDLTNEKLIEDVKNWLGN